MRIKDLDGSPYITDERVYDGRFVINFRNGEIELAPAQLVQLTAAAIRSGLLDAYALHDLATTHLPYALSKYDEGDGTYDLAGQTWPITPAPVTTATEVAA